MKANTTKARQTGTSRKNLNVLMEAMALIIARRQMKLHWATVAHRAALPSII